MTFALERIPSPIGTILLVTSERGVCALDFEDCRGRMDALLERRFGTVRVSAHEHSEAALRVRDYLGGELDALDSLPVDTRGTSFQQRVWSELRTIPAGSTCSYGDLARSIGRPTASRAVGAANGRNPVALVVPCHRVVGSDGSLTGYAGGVERKRWLLAHEGAPL